MADVMTKEQRSRCMSRIRAKGTAPERQVAGILRALGRRFSKNVKTLPGKPDFVIHELRMAVFVNGCFWHRHSCKLGRATPKSNVDFWSRKFEGNKARDRAARRDLRTDGWQVITVWECQLRDLDRVANRLSSILEKKSISVGP